MMHGHFEIYVHCEQCSGFVPLLWPEKSQSSGQPVGWSARVCCTKIRAPEARGDSSREESGDGSRAGTL